MHALFKLATFSPKLKVLAWALFLGAVIVLTILPALKEEESNRRIIEKADSAEQALGDHPSQRHEQAGEVQSIESGWHFSTRDLQRSIRKMPKKQRHFFYSWADKSQQVITGSASGIDENAWFANSYLVGFKPFDTKSIWEPLATLSLRKAYILDHKLYGPQLAEIWQNSRQAFLYTRGDCEDHAIILADWLIALGHEARVVLGKHRSEGHAWVVLFKDGKEYILESTTKKKPTSIRDFKLAALATEYRPMYQFDRTRFWVNSGSIMTTRYRDKKWQLRSHFLRKTLATNS